MPHAPSYTHTHTLTPTPTHPCSRTRARAPAGHVRSQARPHLCPSTLCPRTRSASAHPRTRSPSRTHTDRPVVNGRACSGPSRRPPGTGSLRPSPSTVPDPPTGSPRDPARVLSRLRPLTLGQRWSGPRTYPGQVHCLGRPLVVSLRWPPVGGRPCSSVRRRRCPGLRAFLSSPPPARASVSSAT